MTEGGAKAESKEEAKEEAKAVKAESYQMFKELDADGGGKLQKEEFEEYVAAQGGMWKMLSDNFGLSADKCQEVATQVAMELATEREGSKAFKKGVDKRQFHHFRTKYVEDLDGSVEFFDRCIFRIFDADGDGELNESELDNLLDALYKSSDFYSTGNNPELGELKLPPQATFRKELMSSDRDGDGKFSMKEIQRYLGKLRKRSRKEDARRASDATSFAAQIRAQEEAKFKAEQDKRKAEEEAKRKKEEEEQCVFFEWLASIFGS